MKIASLIAFAASVIGVLAGCGGPQGSVNPAAPAMAGIGPSRSTEAAPQFGVVLGNDGGAAGTGGSKGKSWIFAWCNGVPGNDYQCYTETPGKRKYADNASGTGNLFYGSQPDGYNKAQIAGTSKIGSGSYTMYAEHNEKLGVIKGFSAHADTVGGGWDDTLYISSGSLKKGTPVTIGVQWALTPQTTDIACDAAQNSYGWVQLYSAYITPPSGESQFSISGLCSKGNFVYYLYNNPAKPGKTALGTINTSVGASYPIAFVVQGRTLACQPANKCSGDIFAVLDGSYKFKVTSITSGATYTTASGNLYK